ncbi:hypothetical protein KJ059_09005 [Myxococcota bacterium]|nr:hypothetical protein [Myxococcota bacterium]
MQRDPNDLVAGTSTLRCYDAFGRPVLERGSGNLAETTWAYDDTPGAVQVREDEQSALSGAVRSTTTNLDGLGREVETTSDGPNGRLVVQQTIYDALGRIASRDAPHFSGANAQPATFQYDPLGRVVSVDLPGPGRVTTVERLPGVISETDPNGIVTKREIDPFGSITAVIEDAAGAAHRTTYSYDIASQLGQVTDSLGNATVLSYDLLGRKFSVADPDVGVITFEWDANGNLLTRSDGIGTHSWTYDPLDRPKTMTRAGATLVSWTYDTAPRGIGQLASRGDEAGVYRVSSYDLLGRVTQEQWTVDGRTLAFLNGYDPLGQLARRIYPTGTDVRFPHDAKGFPIKVETLGGSAVYASAMRLDARGRLESWTSGNGVANTALFEPATGRLDRLQVGAGGALESLDFGYDPGDRVTSIQDLRAPVRNRSFIYDALDRLTQATGPFGASGASTALHYKYDAIGNLLCRASTSPSACMGGTELVYPAPGQARPHAPQTVNGLGATYGTTGSLTALGLRGYNYDPLGRLVAARQAGKLLAELTYDADDRRTRMVDHTGPRPVTRHFVSDDFEWDETRGLARIHVRAGGQLLATQVLPFAPPGGSSSAEFDAAVAPAPEDWSRWVVGLPAGTAALLLLLQLAALRRRRQDVLRPALAGSTALVFFLALAPPGWAANPVAPDGDLNGDGQIDLADARIALQIIREGRAPSAEELAAGDVAPLEQTPESPPNMNAADLMLLLRALRGEDLDGDGLSAAEELAAGASPFRADTDRDGLDDAAELVHRTDPANPDTDGDGLSDGQEVAAGTDPFLADTDADGIDDPSDAMPRTGVVFYHADHLGSSTLVTKADGGVLERVTYRPYGETVSGTTPEFGFTGQRFEAGLGIYDYGARWYDPNLGRFLQPDSIVEAAFNPQTLNRYSYVRNNPVNRIDPTGNFSIGGFFRGLGNFGSGLGGGLSEAFIPGFDSVVDGFGSSSTAFQSGRTLGNGLGAAIGFAATITGGGLLLGGFGLDITGVGAAVGVPAQALGLALVQVGSFAAANGSRLAVENGSDLLGRVFFNEAKGQGGVSKQLEIKVESDLDRLSAAVGRPDPSDASGELTRAGRQLTKQGGREGSIFPNPRGNKQAINRQAQEIVDEILTNPKTVRQQSFRGRFGGTTEFTGPDGRGLVFDKEGSFLFFKQ